jgi:F0F1-type ATP synthase membrane subunit c/vacuolar-type H+-ATPase subunit K
MQGQPVFSQSRSNGPATDPGPEGRLRVMRILWAVFLVNVGLFVVVCKVATADSPADASGGVPPLLLVLAALSLAAVAVSFPVKAAFYRRAAERQEPGRLQTGFIIALVLCEVAALLGVVAVFVTLNDYSYLLFALGALGEALHFPTREQVLSAYFKAGM